MYPSKLHEIWSFYDENNHLPDLVRQRRFTFYKHSGTKDVLVLGITPEVSSKNTFTATSCDIWQNIDNFRRSNFYQKRIARFLSDRKLNINLVEEATYIDLFYYRVDNIFKPMLELFLDNLDGRMFLEDQLRLTQEVIEQVIIPKVIIANSMEVAMFLGIESNQSDSNWLGYTFKDLGLIQNSYKLYQITGVKQEEFTSNLFANQTNLVGTYVICYDQMLKRSIRPITTPLKAIEVYSLLETAKIDEQLGTCTDSEFDKVSVDLFLEFPKLYSIYLENKNNLRRKSSACLIRELNYLVTLTPTKCAIQVFELLLKNSKFNVYWLEALLSINYCNLHFKTKEAIIRAVRKNSKYDKRIKIFNVFGSRYFVFNVVWTRRNIKHLMKWYVNFRLKYI